MKQPELILAIVDPEMHQSAATRRAIELARRCGARLHLCMPVFDLRIHATADLVDPEVEQLARQQYIDQRMRWLAEWSAELASQNIRTSCEVLWARKAHEAVIETVRELSPDLVVKDLRRESFLRRWSTIKTSDWRLIRLCPVPLMLVQEDAPILPVRVAAAVDPVHPQARPTELDDRVVRTALPMAMAANAELELIHVFPYRRDDEGMSVKMDEVIERLRREDTDAFASFARGYSVPAERRVLLGGDPVKELLEHVEASGVDLLVIGSQYRGGFERLLLGSNAESLISHANCDLLLVRPDGFTGEPAT